MVCVISKGIIIYICMHETVSTQQFSALDVIGDRLLLNYLLGLVEIVISPNQKPKIRAIRSRNGALLVAHPGNLIH